MISKFIRLIKQHKRIAAVFVLCFIIMMVVSVLILHNHNLSKQIEDITYDSKELGTITDEKIESCYLDYQIYKHHKETKDGNISGVTHQSTKKYDKDFVRVTTGMLSGIYIVNSYRGDGNILTYKVTSEVKGGNLKIVLTDENNKILEELPIDIETTFEYPTDKDKTYYLKLVGESAEIEFTLYRNGYK